MACTEVGAVDSDGNDSVPADKISSASCMGHVWLTAWQCSARMPFMMASDAPFWNDKHHLSRRKLDFSSMQLDMLPCAPVISNFARDGRLVGICSIPYAPHRLDCTFTRRSVAYVVSSNFRKAYGGDHGSRSTQHALHRMRTCRLVMVGVCAQF